MPKAAEGKCVSQQGASFSSPSPGTPGEGRGEGDFEDQVRGSPRVRAISRTRCLELATPDTSYFQSPSPYPLPEYRERESAEGFAGSAAYLARARPSHS